MARSTLEILVNWGSWAAIRPETACPRSAKPRVEYEAAVRCSAYAQQAAGKAMRKVCVHAGSSSVGVRTAQAWVMGRMFRWLGPAGSGGDDAVRLAGCEGSVSLAWRTGEG